MNDCTELATLLRAHKGELLDRWRERTRDRVEAAQPLDLPTLNDHVPMVIDGVIEALAQGEMSTAASRRPTPGGITHGGARLRDGYDPADVVAELAMLRTCTFELAETNGFVAHGRVLRALNEAYDRVIGDAVAGYAAAMNDARQRHLAEHLSFIAHDLRTPLGAISLAIEALVRSSPTTDAEATPARLLRNLGRNVTQLTRIVDDVLESNLPAVTETQSKTLLRSTQVNLRTLVDGLASDLETRAEATNTTFRIDIPVDLELRADSALLGRALQNLFANAIEYAAPGAVEVQAELQGDTVHCRIRDHGRGISGDPLARLLEDDAAHAPSGRSGADRRAHRGLGLLIARQFIEAHGGHLNLLSQPDGTTIHIELPARRP